MILARSWQHIAVVGVLSLTAGCGAHDAPAVSTPQNAAAVSTIAGSGALGFADGPALSATFVFPMGLAIGKTGTIYLTDRDAQRIREISPDGNVRTLAGSGELEPPGNFVKGGFRDGPALQAQFDSPTSITVGPDDALYITESYNATVRKLANGVVSTVLGKPGDSRAVDGPRSIARLVSPSAIAFDNARNMYIADNGGGLREWTTGGVLKTIHLKNWVDPKNAIGVLVSGDTVMVTSREGLFAYHPASGTDIAWGARSPSEGDLPYGAPTQLAAIDGRQFVYTDQLMNNVNYVRPPVPPFSGQIFARTIAGGAAERHVDNSGFKDGTLAESRFYAPEGIAILGNAAYVADGGNRRIRKIVLPRTRVSEIGFDPANQTDSDHYEVELIGSSWTFFDSLGDDSICASIEQVLDASHRLSKPVRCHTVRIDAGYSNALEDYIKNVFTVEHADLVIFDAESWALHAPDAVVAGDTPGTTVKWGPSFRTHMQQLLKTLEPQKTQLALVWIYPAQAVSNAEWITLDPGEKRRYPTLSFYNSSIPMERQLAGLPILQYDEFKDLLKYEMSPGAAQLYQGFDQHPNPRGNAFMGTHFAQGLLDAGLGKP